MNWFVIATLKRGRLRPHEQLCLEGELQATESLFRDRGLGVREWTTRWTLINSTPEELYGTA